MKTIDPRIAAVVLVLGLSVPPQAWGEATLRVFEAYVTDISTPVLVPPFGFFAPSDPTLVSSRRFETPIGPHDDHTDGFLAFDNVYVDNLRVNGGRTFGCPIGTGGVGCGFAPEPGHSGAFASGWADAGLLSFGVHSEAFDHGAESAGEAITDAAVRNRFTISPGSSGLPLGTTVKLRWNFRFKGSQNVAGRTFPNNSGALATSDLVAEIKRGFCIPGEGGCFPPSAASFDLSADDQAADLNPLRFGETGLIIESRRWSASNNLGLRVGDSDSSEIIFRDENVTMPTPGAVPGGFGFSTGRFEIDTARPPIGLSFLDFEATVGETLEFRADAFTFTILGGGQGGGFSFGSARNAYFGTFESGIVDPENRGLAIVFEISATPADTTPPTTTVTVAPAPNANGWNNTDVRVTVTGIDDAGGSGVKEIAFSLAGAETLEGVVAGSSATVTVTAEGTATLTYFARDNSGNQEAAQTLTIRIDKTEPTVTCVRMARRPRHDDERALFRVTASDTLSQVAGITLGGVSLAQEEIIQIRSRKKTGIRLFGNTDDDRDKPRFKRFKVGPGEAVILATDLAGNVGRAVCPLRVRQHDDDDDDHSTRDGRDRD